AVPLLRRALAIDEKSLGPDHPTVASLLSNLAQVLQATNGLGEAEPLMRRALAIDEKGLGPDHPNVARDLNNLAELFQATNRLSEVEPLLRRALAILLDFSHRTGHEHTFLQGALDNYAEFLKKMGKSDTEIEATIRALGWSPG
ncbi:MAG TPA: tetratricopeptide repeat protein, partial [Thermoanaerobaculia bacterium]|nr:tetratricopeptide repeat protein [Thermoanaerobaculia bacterium]